MHLLILSHGIVPIRGLMHVCSQLLQYQYPERALTSSHGSALQATMKGGSTGSFSESVWFGCAPPPIIGAQYSVCESVRRSQGHKEKHQRAERVSCPRPRESLTIMELRAATGISVSLHHFGPPQAARYVDEGGFAYRNRHVDTEAR